MRIALVEPYFTGSHRAWAEGFAARSGHDVRLHTLPGRFWKWRMHGGGVTLAREFLAAEAEAAAAGLGSVDLVLATDMLDLPLFLGLTRYAGATAVYFHENQFTYPWSPNDTDPHTGRDGHFCFINYSTALAADRVFFNSDFHRQTFLGELPGWLKKMPDHRELDSVDQIAAKSEVMHLGMDLARLDAHRPTEAERKAENEAGLPPLVLWNHRWEYDKDPATFFRALFEIDAPFRLAVLGDDFGDKHPAIFDEARERLADRIVQWGKVEDGGEYVRWLWRADILPVTSRQDFFGGSVVEAMYCDTEPLLPRRLAFPEHTDADVFYDSDEEFRSRLAAFLVEGSRVGSLRSEVSTYDWGSCIEAMDQRLAEIQHRTKR